MVESFADKLRETTEQAKLMHEEQERITADAKKNAEADKLRIRYQKAAEYVAAVLIDNISETDKKLFKAAESGEDSTTLFWSVRHYKIVDSVEGIYRGDALNPDTISDETTNVLVLRGALADHYSGESLATFYSEKPDGFDNLVPDYGLEFIVTGKVYGLTISWVSEQSEESTIKE